MVHLNISQYIPIKYHLPNILLLSRKYNGTEFTLHISTLDHSTNNI